MDMFDALYDELRLSRVIGIRRRFIARWRGKHGREGDFGFLRMRVGMTEGGVRRMCEALRFLPPESLEGAELEDDAEVVSVRVIRPGAEGARWVGCRRLVDGAVVNVFVRDAGKFVAGDEFDVRVKGDVLEFGGCARWPEGLW